MTMLGKILVFLNLILSLVFASWAVAVFTQRVNLSDKNDGRVQQLREELTKWNGPDGKTGPRPMAEARWLTALAEVRAAETLREKNQKWYEVNKSYLENGAGAKGDPVKRVAYVGGVLEREGSLPKLVTVNDKQGKPLEPRTGLLKQRDALTEEIAKVQTEIRQLAVDAAKLTNEAERVFIEIGRTAQAREGSVAEQRYLERLLYNVQVEGELLLERQAELQTRLNELKSTRTALEKE